MTRYLLDTNIISKNQSRAFEIRATMDAERWTAMLPFPRTPSAFRVS